MNIPSYDIRCYTNGDSIPDEVEKLFTEELESSRKPLPMDRPDRRSWRFINICAVTAENHILGGVHLDIGPINFGPLGKEKLAYTERVFVHPEYRRCGVATQIMRQAVSAARDAGCLHMRCNVKWDNLPGIALYRKCGFALADIKDEDSDEYFVIKPLQAEG